MTNDEKERMGTSRPSGFSMRELAWEFLLREKIHYLPVNPFYLIFSKGYYLLTYQEYSAAVHRPVEYISSTYDNDGFTFWSQSESCFIICYNAALPLALCRWTLIHELAHIELEHINATAYNLSRVRENLRSFFEIEAQNFTRRILCPSIVLHNCHTFTPEEIMRLCGISRQAALFRSQHMQLLEERGQFRSHPLERKVEQQFKPFTDYYLRIRQLSQPHRPRTP